MQRLQMWFIRWPIGMGVAFGLVLGLVVLLLDRASGGTGSWAQDLVLPLCLTGGAVVSALLTDRRRGGPFDDRAGTALAALLGLGLAAFGLWQVVGGGPAGLGALVLIIGVAVLILAIDRARRWERT